MTNDEKMIYVRNKLQALKHETTNCSATNVLYEIEVFFRDELDELIRMMEELTIEDDEHE